MAPKRHDPDQQLAELHEKRMTLALRRDAHSTAQGAAERVIEGSADRRSVALLAEARGETPSPSAEEVDRVRHAAEVAVRENRERAAALRQVEREVEEEVEAVIDAHPAHFVAKAEATSEAAAEAITAAKTAAQAAAMAWREAAGEWSAVRQSYRRRGLESPPEVPISDLGAAVNELEKSQTRPFPGGSHGAWERFRAREQAAAA
jgi:hypothetical protein